MSKDPVFSIQKIDKFSFVITSKLKIHNLDLNVLEKNLNLCSGIEFTFFYWIIIFFKFLKQNTFFLHLNSYVNLRNRSYRKIFRSYYQSQFHVCHIY